MRMVLLERSDHSVLVGQRRVFASEVEDVIYRIPELLFAPYYLIKSAQQPQHELILRIGCPEEKRKRPERLLESVVSRLREKLGVEARVQLVGKEDERVLVGYKRTKVIPESDLGQKGRKR
jgi:phenylacetate-coenzyme A ligase PaaK-like adenylate-forming protein